MKLIYACCFVILIILLVLIINNTKQVEKFVNTNKTTIIHIGKCGGTSLYDYVKLLKTNAIESPNTNNTSNLLTNISFIHVTKPKYNTSNNYIILIRNPIQRFISAFNWRQLLVNNNNKNNANYKKYAQTIKHNKNRFKGEKQLLMKYNTIEKLINELDKNNNLINGENQSGNYIHHLKEDINYYLNPLIYQCRNDDIKGVICQETLEDDIQSIFNVNIDVKINKLQTTNSSKKYTLPPTIYTKLKQYLHKDYECIDKLYSMGCINKKQYLILSK